MQARDMVYPQGGFKRATQYVIHRLRRLPDDPHRVARGMFAGFLVGCLPIPGLQFLAGAGLAWVMRGNVLAAMLATFNSNPVTTPIIAVFSIGLGHWLLGVATPLSAEAIARGFAHAGGDLWHNASAIFNGQAPHWDGLLRFWNDIYLPYLIGSLIIGVALSIPLYYITIPVVRAYQKARANAARDRALRRRAASNRAIGDDAGGGVA